MTVVENERLERAVIETLNAEVKGAGETVKSMAEKVGKNYYVFRKYMLIPGAKDQVTMPLPVFLAVCEALGIEPQELMQLAERRMNRG